MCTFPHSQTNQNMIGISVAFVFHYSKNQNNPSHKPKVLLLALLLLCISPIWSQKVKNVPKAFNTINENPITLHIGNTLNIPAENGHFQGVQVLKSHGRKKLLVSGSSQHRSYILQADMETRKTDTLITLMEDPFRHAGGIQVSNGHLAVGIEDNFTKTIAKACIYNYNNGNLFKVLPNVVIDRTGEDKRPTAGATGLLARDEGYLMVVANWDSRIWDFYAVDPDLGKYGLLKSFNAPDDWASYQSINLIMDDESVYAIGFYKELEIGRADLIYVSGVDYFNPQMQKIGTKAFNCTNGVDFIGAAGLEVDDGGKLHIWATQKNASERIAVNVFSQK